MKKLILATAVAALSVSAQAAPTVYGKIGVKAQYQEDGDVTLDTQTTRFGLKGGEAITANTDFIYGAEFGFNVDSANDGKVNFDQRDTFVGLSNAQYGTVKAGRLTAIDDEINFTNPSEYKDAKVLGSVDGPRVNNALAYVSPKMNGFTALAMYGMTDSNNGAEDNDTAGTYGVAAKYENGPLVAGISYLGDSKDSDFSDVRVSAAYNLNPAVKVSGLYQVIDTNTDDNEQSYIVAAEYDVPASNWDVYAEYDGVTNLAGLKDVDQNVFSVGGNYSFTDATKAQVFLGYTETEVDNESVDSIGGGVGIVHAF